MAKIPAPWKIVIDQLIAAALKNMGSFKSWFVKKFLLAGAQYLYDFFSNLFFNAERKRKQEEAQKKYDEVMKKPDATDDEKGKAYEDLINSGR